MFNQVIKPVDMLVINWEDRDKVIKLARKFGPGYTVIKHTDGKDYNIVKTARVEQYRKATGNLMVVFRT
jgi:hypothetical protein